MDGMCFKTILLVEDEPIIAMAEKRRLENDGYKVILVPSGEEAVRVVFAGTERIDLILMDVDLGKGMDGTEAARVILKDHEIPVLFLSSHIEEEIVEKTEAISSYGYVVKESSYAVLKASINMAFRLHSFNQQIVESARRFQAMKQTSMAGFLVLGMNGAVLEANDAYSAMSGYEHSELLSMKIHELDANESPDATEVHGQRIMRRGSERFDSKHRRKDGSTVDVEVSVTFVPEQKCLVVFLNDITKRKAAEEALREASALRQVLLEHFPDGIVIIDPATASILEFNEAAHRQLGYTREEFAKLSIPDLEAMESPQDMQERIAAVVQYGRRDFETLQRTRTGEIRNIFVTAQIADVHGKQVYHCIWRDITEQKQRKAIASL
jgi:PAS domain S-box-containing protein